MTVTTIETPADEVEGPATELLLASLRAVHRELDDTMLTKWRRGLPWGDLLGDRWERARRLGFGEGVSIYDTSHVFGDVKVGHHTWIGPFTMLDGSGGLTIGSHCSISTGVQIYTHESLEWALTGGTAAYTKAPVSIGSNCYIGSLAVIRMGVTIGNRAVIGAGAFVNKNVADNAIVVGAPAKVIGRVEDDGNGGVKLVYH